MRRHPAADENPQFSTEYVPLIRMTFSTSG